MEKEMAGMYLSGHPIDEYAAFAKHIQADSISEVLDTENEKYRDRQRIKLLAIIASNKSQMTKSNRMMAFVTVEDRYGSCEVIVFPNVLEQCGSALYVGSVVEIDGTLSMKEDEEPRVIAEKIIALPPVDQLNFDRVVSQKQAPQRTQTPLRGQRLYLKVPSLQSREYLKAKNILEIFRGNTKVIFYLSDTKTQMLAPQSLWASLNDTMLSELSYQLGEDNVKLK